MLAEINSIDLPSGVTLEYAEQGDPSAPPVLFLHGLSDSWRSFELVLPLLPESIHAFALTQRGHGDSSRPEAGYLFRDFAADVAAFMDVLGLEAAVIVGHSMGSGIARRFALDYPERSLGLVLAASFASFSANAGAQQLWEEGVSELEDPVDPNFVREFQLSTISQPVPEAFLETIIRESLKMPARVWKATVAGSLQEDFKGGTGKIKAPTMLIWGDHDEMVPHSEQIEQLAEIPDSRLVTFEGTGHAVHWEQPDRFASDVARFIERTGT